MLLFILLVAGLPASCAQGRCNSGSSCRWGIEVDERHRALHLRYFSLQKPHARWGAQAPLPARCALLPAAGRSRFAASGSHTLQPHCSNQIPAELWRTTVPAGPSMPPTSRSSPLSSAPLLYPAW